MKKIILLFIGLIFCSNSLADNHSIEPYRMNVFTKWLFDNGHHEYLEINKTFDKQSAVCEAEPKYSHLWYYNKCDQRQYKSNIKIKNNLKINIFEGWIPENKIDEKKNIITKLFYTNFLN